MDDFDVGRVCYCDCLRPGGVQYFNVGDELLHI